MLAVLTWLDSVCMALSRQERRPCDPPVALSIEGSHHDQGMLDLFT
jgi:hypothetical protein